ncbi:DUF6193 family natural product biosynthesis protein [Streptomyces sp. NPDC001544]|uniref:DUF6193 family natural product biosynthesis protein n=1 Tax=Streptomyces sp. NPDC001544 TaxID=3364584 RepID=UPI0036AC46B0
MAEAPDAETAWQWLLERRPGTRGQYLDDEWFAVVAAAHAEPRLRGLYPFPTHGTLKLLRDGPPFEGEEDRDMPYVICSGPPHQVHTIDHGHLGETATPEEAVALVVTHLPPDVRSPGRT